MPAMLHSRRTIFPKTPASSGARLYYVIVRQYTGDRAPPDDSNLVAWIATRPGSNEPEAMPCLHGLVGNVGDWLSKAYGQFDTIEEARTVVRKLLGERLVVTKPSRHACSAVEVYTARRAEAVG